MKYRQPKIRFYFEQYGQVWSLSYHKALELCQSALKGHGYNLDELGKRINKRSNIKYQVYKPLDYDVTDFQECERDIKITFLAATEPKNDELDPSPYCSSCQAKSIKDCKCGPIADNE